MTTAMTTQQQQQQEELKKKMTANNEEYIRRNKIVIVDDDGNCALHYAAALGNIQVLQKEIAKGYKLDPENYLGWTPLMMAARKGDLQVVRMLLAAGADATKENKYNYCVFLMSVTSGDLDVVKTILEHLLYGGVSRRIMQRVLSPISLSLMFGHAQIFSYLIERQFDVNAATPTTNLTPLMFAAAIKNSKARKRLVHKHADRSKKNYNGQTAHDITLARSNPVYADINLAPPPEPKTVPPPLVIVSQPPTTEAMPPTMTPNPMMISAPQLISPQLFYSPGLSPAFTGVLMGQQPAVFIGGNGDLMAMLNNAGRKSSNFSPEMWLSPKMSPIPASMIEAQKQPQHQVFFGPNFNLDPLVNATVRRGQWLSPEAQIAMANAL